MELSNKCDSEEDFLIVLLPDCTTSKADYLMVAIQMSGIQISSILHIYIISFSVSELQERSTLFVKFVTGEFNPFILLGFFLICMFIPMPHY